MHYPPLGDINSLLQKALFLRDPKVSEQWLEHNWLENDCTRWFCLQEQQLACYSTSVSSKSWCDLLNSFIMLDRSQVKMRKAEVLHMKWKREGGRGLKFLHECAYSVLRGRGDTVLTISCRIRRRLTEVKRRTQGWNHPTTVSCVAWTKKVLPHRGKKKKSNKLLLKMAANISVPRTSVVTYEWFLKARIVNAWSTGAVSEPVNKKEEVAQIYRRSSFAYKASTHCQ